MFRLLKFIIYLVVIATIGVIGFAYLGDLSPEQEERSVPVELNAG